MSVALFREMFDRDGRRQNAELIEHYYDPDFLMYSGRAGARASVKFRDSRKLYTAITRGRIRRARMGRGPDKAAGRCDHHVATWRGADPVEVVSLPPTATGRIHRIWETTWPSWRNVRPRRLLETTTDRLLMRNQLSRGRDVILWRSHASAISATRAPPGVGDIRKAARGRVEGGAKMSARAPNFEAAATPDSRRPTAVPDRPGGGRHPVTHPGVRPPHGYPIVLTHGFPVCAIRATKSPTRPATGDRLRPRHGRSGVPRRGAWQPITLRRPDSVSTATLAPRACGRSLALDGRHYFIAAWSYRYHKVCRRTDVALINTTTGDLVRKVKLLSACHASRPRFGCWPAYFRSTRSAGSPRARPGPKPARD